MADEAFDFSEIAQEHQEKRLARNQRAKRIKLIVGAVGLVAVVAASVALFLASRGDHPVTAAKKSKPRADRQAASETREEKNATREASSPQKAGKQAARPPEMAALDDVTFVDGPLTFQVEARPAGESDAELVYNLGPDAPEGATIDRATGRFQWDPTEAKPGQYRIMVEVRENRPRAAPAIQSFSVRVESAATLLARLLAELRQRGEQVEVLDKEFQSPYAAFFKGDVRVLLAGGGQVHAFQYDTPAAARQEAGQVSPDAAKLFGKPRAWQTPAWFFRRGPLLVLYTGGEGAVQKALAEQLGEPFAAKVEVDKRKLAAASPAPTGTTPTVGAPGAPPPASESAPGGEVKSSFAAADAGAADEALLAMYRDKKLFVKKEYPKLRKHFADRFERQFADEIHKAYGDDVGAMQHWLDEHDEIKEELYTALRPEFDDVAAALTIFKRLKDEFPEQIASYGELAIAVAVTWDKESGGVYDYRWHAERAKSPLAGEPLDAVGNFRYLLEAESSMQGRAQFLPWEFLTHVVNHRTPADERKWALNNYLARREMFGKCYSDVPYDTLMLKTESQQARLNGSEYTLANLLRFGGVCAHQADFASRVGKCLGVPAEYVSGKSAYGDLHAWVVWVEIKSATKGGIGFSVESHGRYRGDKYYVGELRDPQTGEPATDRELELRLHMVGVSPQLKRHADLAMRAFPAIRDGAPLDAGAQYRYLAQVTGLCAWNEAAWLALGELARDGAEKKQSKLIAGALERLFKTFAAFPDFTWKVFDDLTAFQKKANERNALYERLVTLYEAASRPDLACEARLKLSDYLADGEKYQEAVEGLAVTIKRFPGEGRYVPRLLDKLEALCQHVKGADGQLLTFYQEFLPLVPTKRGDDPSTHCVAMYERAIARFKAAGQTAAAQTCAAQLALIKAGKP